MEKTEPTFVPEWLKSSGGLTTSHQFTSASLHTDEQGVPKSVRNKSLVNSSNNDFGSTSISNRTASSYFRRNSSISNDSALLRPYRSFGRNHRDRDLSKDVYEFRNKEKSDNKNRDYNPLGNNLLPSRFEKDGLRRSHSSISAKREDSWTRKSVSDLSIANRSSHNNGSVLVSGGSSVIKTSFDRDFPSLGADEKQVNPDIGRIPSPGLSSAIQSLPIGSSAVIGGDGWTSALAEVPVIVGSNGNGTSVAQPVQPTSISSGGRNMAETLAHGPLRTQTAPQLTVGTQRLEELAMKQSRQLIPMTPTPKALALYSSDKPKPKVGQSQLQNSHLVNHLRPVSVKSDVPKTSSGGKLLVLKPSRERNGVSKESSSPTSGVKLSNSPLAVTSSVAVSSVERKPSAEKRPSSQAQSRNNFFNLMRKKSMTSNSSVSLDPDSSISSPTEKPGEPTPPSITCNGDTGLAAVRSTNNGKNHSGPDAILYSEEEEARFLRSLGWDETAEEEEGLTEEEISSFYRNYLNLKPALKEASSDAKVDG